MPPPRSYPAKPADVYLFGTCVLDLFDPEAGVSAAALLEREGIRVHYPPEQTCCGQPGYTSGFPEEARRVAAAQLSLFPEPWPVVVPSGSCAGMMRLNWPALFADDPQHLPAARAVGERVFELTEFLVHVCGTRLDDRGGSRKVVLHTSCTARREMGTHLTGRALLAQCAGVETAQQAREAECCGFGGTFSVRQPDISAAMAADKAEALEATGAEVLVSADAGCLLNINGTLEKRGSRLRGQHIATFLLGRLEGRS
ncbi:MAG: (Fe-S)-binding protein [Rhodocyclaceae bacterium]|nr:(Fe-S)-binding protein [Rhodocyclaceae bacterium]